MNSFTYIIRSDDRIQGTATNPTYAFDCQIYLRGLPTKYKTFLVEVVGFYADNNAQYYLELFSDNFPFINGYDTKNKSLHVLYATALLNNSGPMVYKINNFNGQYINFKILDEKNVTDNNVTDWKVILKLTGIEE